MRLLPLALIGLTTACAQQGLSSYSSPPASVSYAWVSFDKNGIRSSQASGEADRTSGRALTIDDPVRIASVSKLIVALGVMRLVEEGKLNLDEDVSNELGWTLRNPAFPDRPITLRLLLSHRSSLTDDADYVIPLGQTVQDTVAKAAAFDSTHAPGTYFRYSNLNFPVVASVMEKASGERFDRLMDRIVLKPLDLASCFNWSPCSPEAIGRAVALYDEDGKVLRDDLRGKPPPCPVVPASDGRCELDDYVLGTNGALFSPQGGLRISARDLAVVGQLLLNRGQHRGQHFLNATSIETLTRPVWTYDGSNGASDDGFYCAYGLAAQSLPVRGQGCRDDLFGDGRAVVGHAGEAYGVRSGLWVDRRRGVGIAYFAANNGSSPPTGRTAYRAIEEWLAAKIDD